MLAVGPKLRGACLSGDAEAVSALLGNGCDAGAPLDATGAMALHLTAERGACGVVTLLLRRADVDVGAADAYGDTALSLATTFHPEGAVTQLLRADPRIARLEAQRLQRRRRRFGRAALAAVAAALLACLLRVAGDARGSFEVAAFLRMQRRRFPGPRGALPGGCAGKVLFIGWRKTGTSSVHAAFRYYAEDCSLHNWTWRHGDRELLSKYEVFSDGCDHDLAKLVKACPKAHYVYNTRNAPDLVGSMLAWRIVKERGFQRDAPYLPKMLHSLVDRAAIGCGLATFDVRGASAFVRRRLELERNVARTFLDADLKFATWQLGVGWPALIDFLQDGTRFKRADFAARFKGKPPHELGLGGRLDAAAYRCVRRVADAVADAALELHRVAIGAHCAKHPRFCEQGAWELRNATSELVYADRVQDVAAAIGAAD
ncbi:hypothetical protein M885DRAFT_626066 [Pelagophyceae sp. CCMP2097]|nr:hypothetical protein M885DRAFT_626066 [Pelagophyceae sp. CCMP2097]